MQHTVLLVAALASVGASLSPASGSFPATTVFTIDCKGTPLPNDCLANSWSNTVVEITLASGDVVSAPTDVPSPTASESSDAPRLTGLPSIVSNLQSSTLVSASTVFTLACTASPLPHDCEVNSWSNTFVEITATPGQVMVNLPTELLVSSTPTASESTTSTASGSTASTGTPGAAVGREVGVMGAVVGGLVAGLAVL